MKNSSAGTTISSLFLLWSFNKVHIFIPTDINPNFFKNKEIEKYIPLFLPLQTPIQSQLFHEEALDDVIFEWASESRSECTLNSVDDEARATLRGEAEPVVIWHEEEDSDYESHEELCYHSFIVKVFSVLFISFNTLFIIPTF